MLRSRLFGHLGRVAYAYLRGCDQTVNKSCGPACEVAGRALMSLFLRIFRARNRTYFPAKMLYVGE